MDIFSTTILVASSVSEQPAPGKSRTDAADERRVYSALLARDFHTESQGGVWAREAQIKFYVSEYLVIERPKDVASLSAARTHPNL